MKTIKETMTIMGIITSLLAACAGERPQDLGIRDGRLSPCPNRPNCVSSQSLDQKSQIAPLVVAGDPRQSFERFRSCLSLRPDTTIVAEQPDYLRVEFRTTFFVDDGEFFLNAAERCIEVRSASRLGYSDLGKNRSRIEEIRRAFAGEDGGNR